MNSTKKTKQIGHWLPDAFAWVLVAAAVGTVVYKLAF